MGTGFFRIGSAHTMGPCTVFAEDPRPLQRTEMWTVAGAVCNWVTDSPRVPSGTVVPLPV